MRNTNLGNQDTMKFKKELKKYDLYHAKGTHFLSTCSPDDIENALINYLNAEKIEPTVDENKYKLSFIMNSKE